MFAVTHRLSITLVVAHVFVLAGTPGGRLLAQDGGDTAAEASGTTPAFVSEEGKFSVGFPNQPKISSESLKSDNGDAFIQRQYICEIGNGAILVSFQASDGKLVQNKQALEAAYAATRARLLNATGGQLLDEKDVTVSGSVPARQFHFSIPSRSGEYLTRVFFAEGSFYQLIAVGTPEFIKAPDTLKIIESFQFTHKKPVTGAANADDGLQPFKTNYGRFAAMLPGEPTYSRNVFSYEDGTQGVRHGYVSKIDGGIYLISFLDMSIVGGLDSEGLNDFFGAMVGGMTESTGSELLYIKKQDPVGGQDFWAFRYFNGEAQSGSIGRLCAVGERVFIIQAQGANEFLDAEITNAIINSFQPNLAAK